MQYDDDDTTVVLNSQTVENEPVQFMHPFSSPLSLLKTCHSSSQGTYVFKGGPIIASSKLVIRVSKAFRTKSLAATRICSSKVLCIIHSPLILGRPHQSFVLVSCTHQQKKNKRKVRYIFPTFALFIYHEKLTREYRTFCFIITLLNKGWVQFIDTRRE